MNRKPVKFLLLFLSLFSLNDGSINKCRLIISFALVICPTLQFLISAIKNNDTIYNIVFPASHTFVLTGIVTNLICLLCKRKNIRLLLERIDCHIYTYSDESTIEPGYAWIEQDDNMVRVLMGICSYNIFIGLCMSVSPLVQLLVMGKVDILVYPGWIPWRIDNTTPFFFTYIMHICMAAMCILAFDLLCVFPLLITFEFRRQRKRLCAALASIEKRTEKKVPDVCNDGKCYAHRYNAVMKDNIIECVRHHQMLIENFEILQSWWVIVFSMQLAGSIVNFTLSVFTFMETTELHHIISTFGVLPDCIIGLLLNCYIGEEFLKLNVEVGNVLFYDINWYEKTADVKQLLIIFHVLICRRSFVLNGFYVFQASYQTFAYICRTSYSCLNILKASSK